MKTTHTAKHQIGFPQLLSGIGSDGWMMSLEERLVLWGVVSATGGGSVLELGYGEGGCTRFLSSVCRKVTTVDLDPAVLDASALPNVAPLQMTTQDALSRLAAEDCRFDLAIVDAGHDTDNVRQDILGAAKIADLLILHDVFYPPTRRGALEAVARLGCWHNLGIVAGYFKDGALWGGLGLVCPSRPAGRPALQSDSLGHEYLSRIFEIRKQRHLRKLPHCAVRLSQLFGQICRDANRPL